VKWLTGHEASILAYLARFPDAPDVDEVINRLSNTPKAIAYNLIGRESGNTKIKRAANELRNWAAQREIT